LGVDGRTLVPELLDAIARDGSPSGRVVLTTVFGDALLPRNQAISVQQLARLVADLGINERLVRTSLLRMSRESLVIAERVGRRSFYRVHPNATAKFANADGRIYARANTVWDGQWTLAILDEDPSEQTRERLSRELQWLGMVSPAPGTYVSAVVSPEVVREVTRSVGGELAVLARTEVEPGTLDTESRRSTLIDPDGKLRRLHTRHLELFQPVAKQAHTLEPNEAFTVRTLLITNWRRIALRSPELPSELLPAEWLEGAAFDLTRSIHDAVRAASEAWLDDVAGPAETDDVEELLLSRW
jgi:phenylacetic acid degradation operon negative regulatory protein